VSRLCDRERGARSAALTLAGPRLCSGYPGYVIREPASKTKTETPTDPIRVWFVVLTCAPLAPAEWRGMGHVAAEFLAQRRCIVRINLRVIAPTRDRNVCHAAVEQILGAQLGVPRE